MSFTVYHGLHGAAAEGFASAAPALQRLLDLERRGATSVYAVDSEGREVDNDQLARLAAGEESLP
ncbi:MAG TPA: hypothetical protein VGX37_06485 [Allosphingosinicella sp.]|jgi:hypothetical protein|nr:hypothetical protein [Allosphingosinicella sp.]